MSGVYQESAPLRVGVSALFDPADTPHARTFLRALCVARNLLPSLNTVQWLFLDDGADAVRSAEVAQRMVEWKADVIIGHFSSDAALGAAGLYEQAGIPLLTPAATIDRLTLEHANVFRGCPSDRQLASDLLDWLIARRWTVLHIEADASAHGQALAAGIATKVHQAGLRLVADREQAQVEVFAGRLRASRRHWHARRSAGSRRPLVLTDDAASPELGAACVTDVNSYVIGFGAPQGFRCAAATHYRTLFDGTPDTYFRESLLMLHVLARLAERPVIDGVQRRQQLLHALRQSCFETPLGEARFEQGECQGAFSQVWRVGPTRLLPLSG